MFKKGDILVVKKEYHDSLSDKYKLESFIGVVENIINGNKINFNFIFCDIDLKFKNNILFLWPIRYFKLATKTEIMDKILKFKNYKENKEDMIFKL